MANYRPKSLDELNNLYGKSLNAQQEIVKKATVLEEKTQPKETAFAPEETKPEAKTREQAANDQISGYVNDFIKSFGTPVNPDRTAAATVTASMKTVPIGKPAAPVKENEAVKAAAENQSEDKPRLIRNSERNSLFENYKKVMDDEDDYDFSEPEKDKRKPKKLFEKKGVKPDAEEKHEEAAEEKKAEAEEVKPAEAPAKEAAPVKPAVKEEKPSIIEETEVEAPQEAEVEEEKSGKKKRSKAKKEKAPKEKKAKAEKQTHGTVSRAVVMFLIFCVLMSATAVGAVKAFSGINTDELVMGKYRIYTADRDYSRLGIADGDIVVVEHKGIDYNDIFAYEKNPDEYSFARLTTVLNDESVIADDGDLRCLVFNDSVRGVVYKTIPAVGTVAAFIMSDFIVILGALLLLAVILMLVAVFGCKPKQKKEKPEKAKKEKPEKVKKEKKSKKSKKSEAEDFSEDEELPTQEAVANEDGDETDFDAIEADFSFLLNNYIGDDETEEVTEAEEYEENEAEAEGEAFTEEPDEEEPAVKYEISDEQDEDEITE